MDYILFFQELEPELQALRNVANEVIPPEEEEFFFREESHYQYQTDKWDPLDFLEEQPERPVRYSDCTEIVIPFTEKVSVKGMEVGDDRIDVCLQREPLERMIHAQESIFRMKTSENDTFISQEVYNFCEVTSVAPRDRTKSYLKCRVQNDMSNLEYCDAPPLRLLINVTKGPSTNAKASVAGKVRELAMQTQSCCEEAKLTVNLASFVQDAMLNVVRHCPEPKYLPRFMGGCGCKALFNNHNNLYLSTIMYKVTGFSRLYGSATREAEDILHSLSEGRKPNYPILCNALRLGRDYLLGTYDEKVLIPQEILQGKNLKDNSDLIPLYKGNCQDPAINVVENRLYRCKLIVSKTDAITEQNKAKRIFDLILQLRTSFSVAVERIKNDSFERRKAFDYALQANQALQRLISRKANPTDFMKAAAHMTGNVSYLVSHSGERIFSRKHASFLHSGHKELVAAMYCFPRSEDVYVKEEVSMDLLMKVPGIPITNSKTLKIRDTVARAGLWEISSTMYEWALNKFNELLQAPRPINPLKLREICLRDREWVNDDTLILSHVLSLEVENHESIGLISQDERLARRIARQCTVRVLRIPPEIFLFLKGKKDASVEVTTEEVLKLISIPPSCGKLKCVLTDTGSVKAILSKFEELKEAGGKRLVWKPQRGIHNETALTFESQDLQVTFNSKELKTHLCLPVEGLPTTRGLFHQM